MPILSPSMVTGFTTGAAFHVFTSQIRGAFGISLPRGGGPFKIIRVSVEKRERKKDFHLHLKALVRKEKIHNM